MHCNVDTDQLIQSLDETFAYVFKSWAIPSKILGLYEQIWPQEQGTEKKKLQALGFSLWVSHFISTTQATSNSQEQAHHHFHSYDSLMM